LNLPPAFHTLSYFPPVGTCRFSSSKKFSRTVTLSLGFCSGSAAPLGYRTTAKRLQDSRLLYVRHVERRGVDLFREVCARDLEGIVATWKHGAYVSGEVTSWVKIKNPDYSQGKGRWERFQGKRIARESSPTLQRAATS
jgi:hypothetical protein